MERKQTVSLAGSSDAARTRKAMAAAIAALVVPIWAGAAASGAVLVYEPFNYGSTADSGTAIVGTATNANGLTGTYTSSGTAAASNTNLTFSSNFFPTKGGSLRLAGSGNSSAGGMTLNTGAQTGTIWCSYLFKTSSVAAGSTAMIRLAGGSPNLRFVAAANGANGMPGVGYDGTSTTTQSAEGPLTTNTTYLVLAKFTNVGAALSSGNPGVATEWVLTSQGYDQWVAAGGGEANLAAYAFDVTKTQTSGNYAFNNSFTVSFVKTFSQVAYFDELRYGAALADVVPEPASLTALGATSLLLLRRRRR